MKSISLVILLAILGQMNCGTNLTQRILREWFPTTLDTLKVLDISKQKHRNTFSGLTQLEEINLNSNQLSSLDEITFYKLVNLKVLKFNNNQITSFDEETFDGLKSLEILDFSNNKVITLPTKIFSGLTNLVSVHLSGNPVYDIFGIEYLQSLCNPNPKCIVS
jgi:Leucine-rich repeat (LRR) protein